MDALVRALFRGTHEEMAATETSTRAAHAVDVLYRDHAPEVYRYAYAVLGNRSDAEDVTQTTFVNALRALERGDRPRKPSNWLITIAHNIVRQRFRQQQSRPAEVELDRDVPSAPGPDEDAPSIDELVRALQRIPPAQREAIVMRELEGRSYKEIAEILDTSVGALETLLFRARRSLAEELENLVTCDRAELAISNRLDGRLTRKERRRLDAHLNDCPSCARVDAGQLRRRRVFKGLALLPLPLPLLLFKGAPSASAATGLPTIGAAAGTAGGAVAVGGATAKVAAVVAAVAVAGGAGYEGVQRVQDRPEQTPSAPATAVYRAPVRSAPVRSTPASNAVDGPRAPATKSVPPGQAKPKPSRVNGKPAVPPGQAKVDPPKQAKKPKRPAGAAVEQNPPAPVGRPLVPGNGGRDKVVVEPRRKRP